MLRSHQGSLDLIEMMAQQLPAYPLLFVLPHLQLACQPAIKTLNSLYFYFVYYIIPLKKVSEAAHINKN